MSETCIEITDEGIATLDAIGITEEWLVKHGFLTQKEVDDYHRINKGSPLQR